MKMLFQLIALVLIFLVNHPLFAQKKVLPGYYITLKGDTVRGMIFSYTQWNKNPSKVEFMPTGETKQIRLTPYNSRKFVVNGYDEYLSYTGPRLLNPIEDFILLNNKSVVGSPDSSEKVVTFLRLVTRTRGSDLYVLNDVKRTNFFYQLPDQPVITELRYKKTLNLNRISEINDYRQQLYTVFGDTILRKGLSGKLEKLAYDEKNLSSFFQAMFPSTIKRGRQTTATRWIISAGAALNMISIQAGKFFDAVPKTYNPSISPLLSVGFVLPVNRNFGKYFISPQVKLFRYKNTGEENHSTFINSTTYQSSLSIITEISGGMNMINHENFQLFFTVDLGMLTEVGAKKITQLYSASDRTPYGGVVQTSLSSLTYSIAASTGIVLDKKIISLTYMTPTAIGNFVQYTPWLSGIQLRLGYTL